MFASMFEKDFSNAINEHIGQQTRFNGFALPRNQGNLRTIPCIRCWHALLIAWLKFRFITNSSNFNVHTVLALGKFPLC